MQRQLYKKEIYFVIASFLLLSTLVIGEKIFEYYEIKKIEHTTLNIYKHPLEVSNAALKIKTDIYRLDSNMKNLLFVRSKQELGKALKDINLYEKGIAEYLLIINKNILDDKLKLAKQMKELLESWKPIRNKLIKLMTNNKRSEAMAFLKNEATQHILKMQDISDKIYLHARKKALNFKNNSILKTEYLTEQLVFVGFLFLIVFVLIVFYTIEWIRKHFKKNKHLEDLLCVVREINKLIIREKDVEQLVRHSYNILIFSNIYEDLWIVTIDENKNLSSIIGNEDSENFKTYKKKVSNHDNQYINEGIVSIKLEYNKKIYGYLHVHLQKQDIKNNELIILEELAEDIAYAINSINLVKKLKENEERYHMMFQGNKTVELIVDPDSLKIVEANDKACSYHGYIYKELTSMSVNDISNIPKENILQQLKSIKNAECDELYCKHKLKSGDIRDVKVYSGPIKLNSITLIYSIIFDITDSLKYQKERDLIQERLELVLDATSDGIWDWDFITDEIYFSSTAKKIVGYIDQELENKLESWISRIHPDDKEEVLESVQEAKSGQIKFYKNRHRLQRKDGSWIWIEAYGKILFDENKKAIRMTGSIRDISKQKSYEDTIVDLKELYDNIINSIDNIIFVKDKELKYIACNYSFLKLVGKPEKDVIGKNDFEIFDTETATVFRENDENMFTQKKAVSNFEWVTYPDGDKVFLKTLKAPLFDSNKNIIGVVGNSADFTREQYLYSRLKEAQSIAKMGSWEYNLKDKKLTYSNELYNIYGFLDTNKKLDTDLICKRFQSEDLKKVKRFFIKSLVSKNMTVFYNKIHRENDNEIKYLEHRWIIQFEKGVPFKVLGTTQDITELKKKDEMLMSQSRNAAMGEMIGMIAHQWRQPISAISMDANNMLVDIAMGDLSIEKSEAYANSISEQTQHLSHTIDDFRNFFKPDKDVSVVNIENVVNQTLSIVEDSVKNNNIELLTLFETDKKVLAYPRELMQVFVNIITNAKDAILFNKIENAWIAIHTYNDSKYVYINICDNGGGIYDEILQKIFEPYFSTKDEKTGTGLGLYMSKMIIEEHLHGTIKVSNTGEGTCFKISLLREKIKG